MQKIILASQSPRRSQLLQWAEVPFEVMVSDSDETYDASQSFNDIAIHIALNKALAVAAGRGDDTAILAADTIVVCNNTIIGKPQNRQEAIRFLTSLSNNSHIVITGVAILHKGKKLVFADETEVLFHPLTLEQIEFYVDKYKPYDKAGAYAIQEWIGVVGIKSIRGDFYNVMGLPVSRVLQYLAQL